jgi:hypothetical protein
MDELALFQQEIAKLTAAPPATAAATAAPPPTATTAAAPALVKKPVPAAATVGSAPVRYTEPAPQELAAAAELPPPAKAPDLRTIPNADLGPPPPMPAPIKSFKPEVQPPKGAPRGALAQQMMRGTAAASGGGGANGKRKANRQAAGRSWYDPTLNEWPENDHRIFVGDLGNEVNDETLSLAFRQFKSFNKAKVVREKWNNKTKGYGFVSFSDSADMVTAMKQMNGKYIGNRPCKLRKSTWTDRNSSSGKSMGPSKSSRGSKHMSKRFKGTLTH